MSLAELARLAEDERRERDWKRWGPYLAERQWSTVREDYSSEGDSWRCFTHDQAREEGWRDLLLSHEYFHADTGRGLGASHQNDWTALAARLIEDRARERSAAPGSSGAPGLRGEA